MAHGVVAVGAHYHRHAHYIALIPIVSSEYPLLQPVGSNSNQVSSVSKFEQVPFKRTLSEVYELSVAFTRNGEKSYL